MSRGKIKIALSAAEAAHVYRDLRDISARGVHGNRNVSRETHEELLKRLATFLELAYGTQYSDRPVRPPAAS